MSRIAVVLTLTRKWRQEAIVDQLCSTDWGNDEVTFYILIDTTDIYWKDLRREFHERSNELPENLRLIFNSTGNPNTVFWDKYARRKRIASQMNLARELVEECDFVWILEDDTIWPASALRQLKIAFKALNGAQDVAMVSGLQVGRWGYKMLGAWKCDDVRDPHEWHTISPKIVDGLYDVEEVDATGLYCALVSFRDFKDTPFRIDPVGLGPDVLFGLDLRKQGKRIFVMPDLHCGHALSEEETLWPDASVVRYIERKGADGVWRIPKKEAQND